MSLSERTLRSTAPEISKIGTLSDLANFVKSLHASLSKKLDESVELLNNRITSISSEFNSNLTTLTATINDKIDLINVKFETVSQEFNNKLNDVTVDVNSKISNFKSELDTQIMDVTSTLSKRINELERRSCVLDIMIYGIPFSKDENIKEILSLIATKLGIDDLAGVCDAFRLRSRSKDNGQILVKFYTLKYKNLILRSYLRQKSLCLNDVGFNVPGRIYINECLSVQNRNLHKKALGCLKEGKLAKVGTRNGFVVVKWTTNDLYYKILDDADLDGV